jgi:predicted Mrr-cat superfamily restriction endonuclease
VVKVQVKAKPTTKISPDEIRQLNGLVDQSSERGVFVATGGFTAPAVSEAAKMGIQLWDLERLVELFFDCYDNLPEDSQKLVPLRQIWVLDNPQAAE